MKTTSYLLAFSAASSLMSTQDRCTAWLSTPRHKPRVQGNLPFSQNPLRAPIDQNRITRATALCASAKKEPMVREQKLKFPDIEHIFSEQFLGTSSEDTKQLNNLTLKSIWHKPFTPDDGLTIVRLGLLVRQAYCAFLNPGKDNNIQLKLKNRLHQHGYQLNKLSLDKNNTWALILHSQNQVLVNFRGSGSWQELIDNIRFWPTKNESIPVEERTHQRISELFERIWPELERQLVEISGPEKKPLEIYLSGHSLGGSLAKLAALRLYNQQSSNCSSVNADIKLICTFGTPKTLYELSRQAYCQLGLDNVTICVTNHQDIVPILPPDWISPYQEVGEQLHITRDGKIWYKPDPEAVRQERARDSESNFSASELNLEQLRITDVRWIRDHLLDNYLIALTKYMNSTITQHLHKDL